MMFRPYAYGQLSPKTSAIDALIKKVSFLGTKSDTSVSELAETLNSIDPSLRATDDVFVCAVITLLSDIVKDGKLSPEEKKHLASFARIYDNPISNEPIEAIGGRRFVLTGDFSIEGGKQTATEMIKAAGGKCANSVSRATNFVVVGNKGSDAWAFGNYGTKVKKALDFKLTGQSDVKIVNEDTLLTALGEHSAESATILDTKKNRFKEQWDKARVVSKSFNGLTDGQQRVFDLVKNGDNVYLAGLGGTGKSFILEIIINWARSIDKNVIVCAPTGIAALNIGGSTIHRALGIRPEATMQKPFRPRIGRNDPLYNCDLMIVDEISMCRLDLFDYLSSALMAAARQRRRDGRRPCQLVVVGDFSQLPPVVTRSDRAILNEMYGYPIHEGYAFMGESWPLWNFQHVELTEAIRQRDAAFVAALNACRVGDTKGTRWIEQHASNSVPGDAIRLCGKNNQADSINNEQLEALPGAEYIYYGSIDGEVSAGDLPTVKTLRLKPGARVMVLINHYANKYVNGSLGTVIQCEPDNCVVNIDDVGPVRFESHTFEITEPVMEDSKAGVKVIGTFTQLPLKLAYALTIHKSQGQTFDHAVVYPDCWDPGQLYTALSRLTSIEGLQLAHHIPDSSLIASQAVIDFYDGNYTRTQQTTSNRKTLSTKATAKQQSRQPHRWTLEEERYLLDHRTDLTHNGLAEHFGVTAKAVQRKLDKLIHEKSNTQTPNKTESDPLRRNAR